MEAPLGRMAPKTRNSPHPTLNRSFLFPSRAFLNSRFGTNIFFFPAKPHPIRPLNRVFVSAMTAGRLPLDPPRIPASRHLFELADKGANASAPRPFGSLVKAESGKDHLSPLVSMSVGPRRDAPFSKIDCLQRPPQLVEERTFRPRNAAAFFTGRGRT